MNAVVVLSPLAEDDLVEIWCTVAADDIGAADNLVDELHQVTRLLALQPMMGRRRPEIARVVHGARDLEKLQMR